MYLNPRMSVCNACGDLLPDETVCAPCSVPKYTHDCAGCVFLGRWADTTTQDLFVFDLWWCNPGATVIARYGNEGPRYKSTTVDTVIRNLSWDANPSMRCLIEAVMRVYNRGLPLADSGRTC